MEDKNCGKKTKGQYSQYLKFRMNGSPKKGLGNHFCQTRSLRDEKYNLANIV